MAAPLETVRTVADLRARIRGWRKDGLSAGLVPTMGALHEGHFSLVDQSRKNNDKTCVTLFVNPKQFGPDEDFDVYPRTEEQDAAALADRGTDLLFAPRVEEMYPDGSVTKVSVPGIGDLWEGASRPGFFEGVATVVSKLLLQSLPDHAYFGEKDYQQLCVIQRMVKDLDIPVAIKGCPIIREADGLALSSRNAYLSQVERQAAPALNQAMRAAAQNIAAGAAVAESVDQATQSIRAAGFGDIDYVAVCDPASLKELSEIDGPARMLAAAWLGKTRLIDNIPV